MKSVGTFSKWLACGMVLASFATTSVEAAVGKAVVRSVRGTASYTDQGSDWKPLNVGRVLGPGATVRTGASSQVDLFLDENGPIVRLLESTQLGLDKLNLERTGSDVVIETQLDLRQGTIQGVVKKLAAASTYEVKTPNAVAGIRGTRYQISADDKVICTEGSLMVAYTNPVTRRISTHQVNAGQTFVPPFNPATDQPMVRATLPQDGVLPPIGGMIEDQSYRAQRITVDPFVSPVAGEQGSSSSQTQTPSNTEGVGE